MSMNAVEPIESALRVLQTPGRDAKMFAAGMLTVAVAILAAESGMDLRLVLGGVEAEYARARQLLVETMPGPGRD